MAANTLRPLRWSAVPLVLVAVTLLSSVLISARETWRITKLLGEITEVVVPARLLSARLDLGLRIESAALEASVRSGDVAQREYYLTAVADTDQRVEPLERYASMLGAEALERTATVRSRIDEWRAISRALAEGRSAPAQLPAAMRAQRATYRVALQEIARLESFLAAEGSARRDRIHNAERLGLLVHAALVLGALAAVVAVGALGYRERHLTTVLRRRIEEDAGLRHVTRALGGAATREEVMRHIAESATAITHASGSYIECMAANPGEVDLVVHERGGLSSLCMRTPLADSLTGAIRERGGTGSLIEVDSMDGWVAPALASDGRASRGGLVSPLASPDLVFGALVLLRDGDSAAFSGDARRQMHTLADLASSALQRIVTHEAEQAALVEAERRARQQAALREAAEALAAAFTVDEVTKQIARTALEATQAQGAFIEQVAGATGGPAEMVVVRASTGSSVPALGTTAPFAGSWVEHVLLGGGEPIFVPDLSLAGRLCTSAATPAGCSAIVVPLGHADVPFGALFIVDAAEAPFLPDDLARARTFGSLAALAYQKVWLLDEAREGRRVLEGVMRSRSRLMRGFSHDIKNPLGAADGYAELLSDGIYGELSARQSNSIARIRECIHGALHLIDDLHELARAETGHITLSLQPVDLAELVRASGEDYQAAAAANDLSLVVDAGGDPPVVETDGARVRQIVSNLLSNAIKYTPDGSITLRARREPPQDTAEADGWAVIEVSDTGRGIPAEKREVIFEEFTRIGADETLGAGLGLAISQKLAQTLGGRITVQSEVERGSTFTLWLPLRRADEHARQGLPAAAIYPVQREVPAVTPGGEGGIGSGPFIEQRPTVASGSPDLGAETSSLPAPRPDRDGAQA